VTDDNGTPGDGSEDVIVCTGVALQDTCSHQKLLKETTTIAATTSGVDPLDKTASQQAMDTVIVRIRVFVSLVIR
jgi:hypothetical protein